MILGPVVLRHVAHAGVFFIHKVDINQQNIAHQLMYNQRGDLSHPYPNGFHLEQTDGGYWRSFYCDKNLTCTEQNIQLNYWSAGLDQSYYGDPAPNINGQ